MMQETDKNAPDVSKKIQAIDAVHMAKIAWDKVTPKTIQACFRKCLENPDIEVPALPIPSEYSRTQWEEQIDLEPFTEEDIEQEIEEICMAKQSMAADDPEPDPETVVTTEVAMTLARKLRSYLQSNDGSSYLEGLAKIENKLVQDKLASKASKQSKITGWLENNNGNMVNRNIESPEVIIEPPVIELEVEPATPKTPKTPALRNRLGLRGPMLGGLSAGVAAQSPSKRPRSPGVVAQSPAKRLKQQGQIKNFFKPFSCTRCDYKSSTSASLKQHESIHTEKKTFSCTRCDYKSTTSNRLKEHEAIHNPTTSFRGWTDSETAVAALNASVTSASLNASLLNQGFREEDNTDQTYSQEDLEYENTLRALEQEISK